MKTAEAPALSLQLFLFPLPMNSQTIWYPSGIRGVGHTFIHMHGFIHDQFFSSALIATKLPAAVPQMCCTAVPRRLTPTRRKSFQDSIRVFFFFAAVKLGCRVSDIIIEVWILGLWLTGILSVRRARKSIRGIWRFRSNICYNILSSKL